MSFELQMDNNRSNRIHFGLPLSPWHFRFDHHRTGVVAFPYAFLNVEPRHTSSFSKDRTGNDDVFLAVLSLLLLLLIDALLSTALLRTRKREVSAFSFSVKLVAELIQGLCISRTARLPLVFIITAVLLLLFVFGIEALLLFLSESHRMPISNSQATFRILHPIAPNWTAFAYNFRASLNRPCNAMSLRNVRQGKTRINACVNTDLTGAPLELFTKLPKKASAITLRIDSDLHKYGVEHRVELDREFARYSTRAYFSLADEVSRLMPVHQPNPEYEASRMEFNHKLYVAYLFTAYLKATKDEKNANLDRLNDLRFNFTTGKGPKVNLVTLNSSLGVTEEVTRYTTLTTGILPRGNAAFRVAHHFFKAEAAVMVAEPDGPDLILGEGLRAKTSVVWTEDVRYLNWLSICVMLILAFPLLLLLKWLLRPVSITDIAEIARRAVNEKVGEDFSRSPVENRKEERSLFRLGKDEVGSGYIVGAETGRGRLSLEYVV